jgi:hypothetical protein
MEKQLCVKVALLLPEQLLQIIVAPLEGDVVHSNLREKKNTRHTIRRLFLKM